MTPARNKPASRKPVFPRNAQQGLSPRPASTKEDGLEHRALPGGPDSWTQTTLRSDWFRQPAKRRGGLIHSIRCPRSGRHGGRLRVNRCPVNNRLGDSPRFRDTQRNRGNLGRCSTKNHEGDTRGNSMTVSPR
jgi:hypothetical protein